ncbi:c-type cytochrome [Rhizobium halophytocola]|uniref:Mono/diheme cytochrome c family protein n=1 Tax=Rhizobium halophytocola TaxID=735519 RepID=A0ABS4DX08_9HYPH|nr:cytochrome c [Rhizobium halophytocola]MBP1850174.1 mono/diheme cytochrome c family protein [Rhizobium halophytocola]
MVSTLAKGLGLLVAIGVIGAAGFLVVTAPKRQPADHWANLGDPDVAHGRDIFFAGGCSSCHARQGAEGDARLELTGGVALKSPFGTFYPPNISPDPDHGIGQWSLAEFGDAMTRGVGRNGEHLYPSFPYGSYARMTPGDINDLYGFLKTLPASANDAPPHDLPFPFDIRLSLGGWKFLYFDTGPRVALQDADDEVKRGQYLVEGPGHCGECHTPRDALGGFKSGKWLAGGPNPEGEGTIPNITPGSKAVGEWSKDDIVEYLTSGFTPDFDSVGGSMVEVQKNLAELPAADREAIAAYLKAVPAVE